MLLDLRFLWEPPVTAFTGTVDAQAIAQVGATGTVHLSLTGTATAQAIAQVNASQAAVATGHGGGGGGRLLSMLPTENALLSLWAAGEISDAELEMLLTGRNKRRNKT